MCEKKYTKKDIDKIADNVVLFAKIFLGFELDRANTRLMRRFIDIEASELRYSYEQTLGFNDSVWNIEED